jgi:putative copper resistance protein D
VSAFLDIFAFVSVLLRGISLAAEALAVGGVIFRVAIARVDVLPRAPHRLLLISAGALGAAQAGYVAANASILKASTNLTWLEVISAGFCVAAVLVIAGAALVALSAAARWKNALAPIGCVLILCGAVMNSHAAARIEHRWPLTLFTAMHHAAGAAWIGAMPYLLCLLRNDPETSDVKAILRRFSRTAMIGVAAVSSAGIGMSAIYVGSMSALTGTAYGIMLLTKIVLAGVAVALGGLNRETVAAVRLGVSANLLRLRRFAEAEVGIGLTIILAAASLTSSPPAADVQDARVTGREIAVRLTPQWPRLSTPAVAELSPATPLRPVSPSGLASFVPGQRTHPDTPADIAWSEYNHHWAGLIVLAIGVLSLLALRLSWARHWPLTFFALAVFLLVRADSENWPLGPRGFWESFQVAEVAQHRVFVVLTVAFALFEWRVQTSRVRSQRAGLVFPLVCAAGGALLLTHSHSLGNIKEEFLAELSHLPLAILAVMAGWSRWIEVRMGKQQEHKMLLPVMRLVWPVCFVLIGVILLNYREA